METFAQSFFENNAFIINGGFLKILKWTNQLIILLKNNN